MSEFRSEGVKIYFDQFASTQSSSDFDLVMENGNKVLYLEVLRAIYGILVASLSWYRKLRKELEEFGFKFNPHGSRVVNCTHNSQQQTVHFHVHDLLCSCVDEHTNENLFNWFRKHHGKPKPIMVTGGSKHEFLGTTLDFG